MSEIEKLRSKMKSKVKLEDLGKNEETISKSHVEDKVLSEHFNNGTSLYDDKETNKLSVKSRLTVYLDEETEKMFNKMFAEKILSGKKADKSSIVCQAIRSFYNHCMKDSPFF